MAIPLLGYARLSFSWGHIKVHITGHLTRTLREKTMTEKGGRESVDCDYVMFFLTVRGVVRHRSPLTTMKVDLDMGRITFFFSSLFLSLITNRCRTAAQGHTKGEPYLSPTLKKSEGHLSMRRR